MAEENGTQNVTAINKPSDDKSNVAEKSLGVPLSSDEKTMIIEYLISKELGKRAVSKRNFLFQLVGIVLGTVVLVFPLFNLVVRRHLEDVVDKRIKLGLTEKIGQMDSLVQTTSAIRDEVEEMYIDLKKKSPMWNKNIVNIFKENIDNKAFIFYYNKGKEEYKQKNAEAIKSYKNAELIRPDDTDLLYNMSLAYLFLIGNKVKAAEYLKKAIDKNPSYKQIALDQDFRKELGSKVFDGLIKSQDNNKKED